MTTDLLGRYYTGEHVSEAVIATIDTPHANLIVDLGCGDGSLSAAAKQRWRGASIISVDIDQQKHAHATQSVRADALRFDLSQTLGLHAASVDVAVCNPPYIYPRWRPSYAAILDDAKIPLSMAAFKETGAVVLFLAQNLRLLRPGGQLAIIVPDSVVSGQRSRGLRQQLVTGHSVEQIVKLPPNIFKGTDAQTHIVTLTKGGVPDAKIAVRKINRNGTFSPTIWVDPDTNRLDYDYLSQRHNLTSPTISELGGRVLRGSVTGKAARRSRAFVFHTGDFTSTGTIAFPRSAVQRTAREGDILLARVDRQLDRKVCLVTSGTAAITDCVFALRMPERARKRVYEFLSSSAGRGALRVHSQGVAAKYITAESLLNIRIPNRR